MPFLAQKGGGAHTGRNWGGKANPLFWAPKMHYRWKTPGMKSQFPFRRLEVLGGVPPPPFRIKRVENSSQIGYCVYPCILTY